MRLVKFGHACVRLDKDERRIVIDPGVFTPETEALEGVEAILVTHEHADHVDAARLADHLAAMPETRLVASPAVLARLGHLCPAVQTVGVADGETVRIAGFEVRGVGRVHHVGHPDVAPVPNTGFLIDGEVLHPGDALPPVAAPTLLVPLQAPWMAVGDLVRYLRAVKSRRAYAIHDGLLNEHGLALWDGVLAGEARGLDREIRRLASGDAVEVG